MEATAYRQLLELEQTHWWFRGRRAVYFGLLDHHLGGRRPARVLDLGCGFGGFLDGLAQRCEAVYPSDVTLEGMAHCRRRGYDKAVVSGGYRLPYADASFDLVCMFDVIEHIPDDARALREVARVLAPGGLVLASVPAYQLLFANNDRIAQHYRRYTRRGLAGVFEQAGLAVERNSHSNVFLFPLILPAVLVIKAFEKLSRREFDPDHTNLSWPLPAFVHEALFRIFAAELSFTRRFDWPAGHSIVAIARKPASAPEAEGEPAWLPAAHSAGSAGASSSSSSAGAAKTSPKRSRM